MTFFQLPVDTLNFKKALSGSIFLQNSKVEICAVEVHCFFFCFFLVLIYEFSFFVDNLIYENMFINIKQTQLELQLCPIYFV